MGTKIKNIIPFKIAQKKKDFDISLMSLSYHSLSEILSEKFRVWVSFCLTFVAHAKDQKMETRRITTTKSSCMLQLGKNKTKQNISLISICLFTHSTIFTEYHVQQFGEKSC